MVYRGSGDPQHWRQSRCQSAPLNRSIRFNSFSKTQARGPLISVDGSSNTRARVLRLEPTRAWSSSIRYLSNLDGAAVSNRLRRGAAIEQDDGEALISCLLAAAARPGDYLHLRHHRPGKGNAHARNFISDVRSITLGCQSRPMMFHSRSCRYRISSAHRNYAFCYVGVSVNYAASFEQVGEYLRRCGRRS
jgi:hypothetical protein